MRYVLVISLALASVGTLAAETTEFVLERFNGTHTDLGGDVTEIKNGPVTVRPESSSNRFQVHANRLRLTPAAEGRHDVAFWVRFEGEAEVQAEVLMASVPAGQLSDEVTVPEQERTIELLLEIERQETGYLLTVVEAPKELRIHVRSRLAGQIVSLCKSLTRFVFGSSCDGLESAMSNPAIPLAEPGDQFELDAGQLTVEERAKLDAYLATNAG